MLTPANLPSHVIATMREEIAVSTLINAFGPTLVIWLLHVSPPQVLVGPHDILSVLVLGAGVATLLMTLILTLVIRKRVATGGLEAFIWPRASRGAYRLIPQNLLARAIVLASMAIVSLAPLGFALVALGHLLPFSASFQIIFNFLYGTCVGMLMTRFIVLAALAD